MLARFCTALMTGCAASMSAAWANPGMGELDFLEGAWRGGDKTMMFEEIWTAPAGGVMTGMARGVRNGDLAVLEYIVIADEDDRLVMRFKHYRADFSSWEEAGPVTLTLSDAGENEAIFSADPPSEGVKSIRYFLIAADRLQADIVTVDASGEEGGFTLVFDRMD